MSAENHGDLLTVNFKSFLLKVRFKDTLSTTQREADVVAKLLAFSGEFTSCCHNYYFHLLFTILISLPLLVNFVKVKWALLANGCLFGYAEENSIERTI